MWNACLVRSEGHSVWVVLRSHWHYWSILGHWLIHSRHGHFVLRVAVVTNLLRDAWNKVTVRLVEELLLYFCRLLLLCDDWRTCRVLWISVRKRLNLSPATSHSLVLLDLQDAAGINWLDIASLPLTVLLVLLVNVKKQLLDLVTCCHILRIESWTDAEMERFFRLLLLRTFFKSWTLSSKSQFNDFLGLRHVLAALLDDPLHVATFRTD